MATLKGLLAATYEFCADDGEVSIWQWADEQWTPAGRLNNSFAVLALDAPGFVAATALTETALLTTSPVAPARLVVDRVFESFNDGETVAPVCVLPGSRLMLLAEAIGFTEDQPIPNEEFVQLRFFDTDQMDGDGIELPATIVEPEDLEVEQQGDRRVISFQVPPNVGPAFGRLTVQWGELFFDGLDFEISTQDFFEIRAQLTELVSGAVSELFQTPPALIGGYRPLPAGAELTNGLNLEQIRTVEDENRWLFFAFDHQARRSRPTGGQADPGFNQSRQAQVPTACRAGLSFLLQRELWRRPILQSQQTGSGRNRLFREQPDN